MTETVASRILRTLDNDVLLGMPRDNVIDALASNDDVMSTFGGNDTIDAGSGDDNIEVLVSGLESPRKLSFGSDGAQNSIKFLAFGHDFAYLFDSSFDATA